MNIQYVRLDERVCGALNRLALEQRRTVSDLVNEILDRYLQEKVVAGEPARRE